jgi:hypothetical protein
LIDLTIHIDDQGQLAGTDNINLGIGHEWTSRLGLKETDR